MSLDKQSSEEIRAEGMKDDALVDEHVRLSEFKHEPTKGFLQAPLISFSFSDVLFLFVPSNWLIRPMIFNFIRLRR